MTKQAPTIKRTESVVANVQVDTKYKTPSGQNNSNKNKLLNRQTVQGVHNKATLQNGTDSTVRRNPNNTNSHFVYIRVVISVSSPGKGK